MKRRDFIKNLSAGLVVPIFLDKTAIRVITHSPLVSALSHYNSNNDNVLILMQLNGGNDGLNTVIPLDFYNLYYSARQNIAIPENKILNLEGYSKTGLHPSMVEVQKLFNNGQMGIVQAVSYPNPNLSHFRATDIWMTGSDSGKVINTGWAGRFLDTKYPKFPENYPDVNMPDPLAIQIGPVVSSVFQGPHYNMGIAVSNPASFYDINQSKFNINSSTRSGSQLAYIQQMADVTSQYGNIIKQASLKVKQQSSNYPNNDIGNQLKIVARLIAGGLKTKIYMVSTGNTGSFDTHAKQANISDTTTGTHANLLQSVSKSIGAFMEDLKLLQIQNKVVGMTFSEFGRRIKSNANGGTDHGIGAPVFYFGNNIKGGIIGKNPDLPSNASVDDNISMQHDFRSLYATVLKQLFNVDPKEVLMGDFPILPMI